MKRVRYLAGAVGIAPMAIGAVAAGGTPAAAAAFSHSGAMHRVPCSATGDWLKVWQSSGHHADCFADAGWSSPMAIYHFDAIYTGNNRVYASFSYHGARHFCSDPHKDTWVYASQCEFATRSMWNNGTLVYLRIY